MKKHMVERIQDLYVGIDNDLSARREHGKTPQGNELNGRWVLRDSEGNWIDHDQYRSDLFSRHGIMEVETGHLLDTVSKYKARIAELEAELVVEAKKTASEKLRADQMTEQHRMQAKMHAEASEQVVRLKTQLGGAFSTSHDPGPAAIATLQGMGYEHRGGVLWAPPVGKAPSPATPWYPDDSGEWVEVPEDLVMRLCPPGLRGNEMVTVLSRGERERRDWKESTEFAPVWDWDRPAGDPSRIVAYKVVKT